MTIITAGIMLSLLLSSMEGTVVATAMPTIVGQLGGFSIYSWVFSVYLLASTAAVPVYGKLSDVFGRKRIYAISMALFVLGSLLCGLAQTMEQLIVFRAVQGLGAGGVLPLAFIIIGDLFSLEQRARMQGVFSAVWGVSALIGPLVGGFLVDNVSWQWVFLINLPVALLAFVPVWVAWIDAPRHAARPALDWVGALLLSAGVLALMLGLDQLGQPLGWLFLLAAAVLLGGLLPVERRAADPILPLGLLRERLFSASVINGLLAGAAMFGSTAFVPLFVQAVLGSTATQAGMALMPMSVFWTLASMAAGRLLLRVDYRALVIVGMVLLASGSFLMTTVQPASSIAQVMFYTALMGIGMGLSVPAFLIAVQSTVRKQELGIATATLSFFRSIGGTVGVSVMGVYLSTRLAGLLLAQGQDADSISLDSLLSGGAALESVRVLLATAVSELFWMAFGAAVVGLVAVFLAPRGKIAHLMQERAVQQDV